MNRNVINNNKGESDPPLGTLVFSEGENLRRVLRRSYLEVEVILRIIIGDIFNHFADELHF